MRSKTRQSRPDLPIGMPAAANDNHPMPARARAQARALVADQSCPEALA